MRRTGILLLTLAFGGCASAPRPIPPENFLEAEVSSDNVGADQSEARSPDAEWFAAEDEPYGVTDNPDATSEGGMNRYRHTQIGWVMLATAIVPLTIVVGVLGRAGEPLLLLLPLAILIPVLAVFGWLTVTIDDRELNARFGVSPVRKRIALASIASFEPVRNRWYYGFGVRYTPGRGWLYNVSGLDAVEIVLHDGTNIRIGTDEPDAVVHVLSQAVSERRRESTSASGIGAGLPVPVVVVGVILIPVAFVAVLLFLLRS